MPSLKFNDTIVNGARCACFMNRLCEKLLEPVGSEIIGKGFFYYPSCIKLYTMKWTTTASITSLGTAASRVTNCWILLCSTTTNYMTLLLRSPWSEGMRTYYHEAGYKTRQALRLSIA